MLERRGTSPMCQQEAVERQQEPCTQRAEVVDEVPRQLGESGGEINGGALAAEEKQGRGLGGAAWRGEDALAKEGSGSGGVRGSRLRSKPVAPSHPAAGTDGGGAAELRWSWR